MGVCHNLGKGLEDYDIHVGLRLIKADNAHYDPRRDLAVDLELWHRDDWPPSRDAAAYIEKYLAAANEKFLEARLKNLQVTQRALPPCM